MTESAFAKYRAQAWPYRYEATLHVYRLAGGVPSDPTVAEGWLRTKTGVDDEAVIQRQVAEVMAERGVALEEAVKDVNNLRNLNGFKRNESGLFIEGRQVKAALKEAASIAVASDKLPSRGWGRTNKGIQGFVAEHVGVVEDVIPLGVTEASGVDQRFVHTHRGTGISYQEYVEDVDLHFTVISDWDFSEETWATIWLTGEQQGIGATRSQGYGRYEVTRWEQVPAV